MSVPVPYWQDERCSLYVGDCREVLPALGVTADLVLADPPYGETSLPWDRWPDGWLEAARCAGWRAVGIEGDEKYAALAARRLSQADLFSGEVSA